MYQELGVFLATELFRPTVAQRWIIALYAHLMIPWMQVSMANDLPADYLKWLVMFPAGHVFLVEFLFRPEAISLNRILVACLVISVSAAGHGDISRLSC